MIGIVFTLMLSPLSPASIRGLAVALLATIFAVGLLETVNLSQI